MAFGEPRCAVGEQARAVEPVEWDRARQSFVRGVGRVAGDPEATRGVALLADHLDGVAGQQVVAIVVYDFDRAGLVA